MVPHVEIAVLGGATGQGQTGSGVLLTYHLTAKAAINGPLPLTLTDVLISNEWGYTIYPASAAIGAYPASGNGTFARP